MMPDTARPIVNALALAQQLEARRVALRWSVEFLAGRAGYHPNTILRVLHGQNSRVRTLQDVAGALGFSVVLNTSAPAPQHIALREVVERPTLR